MAVMSSSLEQNQGQFIGPRFLFSLSQVSSTTADTAKVFPYTSFPSITLETLLAFFPHFTSTHNHKLKEKKNTVLIAQSFFPFLSLFCKDLNTQ